MTRVSPGCVGGGRRRLPPADAFSVSGPHWRSLAQTVCRQSTSLPATPGFRPAWGPLSGSPQKQREEGAIGGHRGSAAAALPGPDPASSPHANARPRASQLHACPPSVRAGSLTAASLRGLVRVQRVAGWGVAAGLGTQGGLAQRAASIQAQPPYARLGQNRLYSSITNMNFPQEPHSPGDTTSRSVTWGGPPFPRAVPKSGRGWVVPQQGPEGTSSHGPLSHCGSRMGGLLARWITSGRALGRTTMRRRSEESLVQRLGMCQTISLCRLL